MFIKTITITCNAHISYEEDQSINSGQILVKIPRLAGKTGDITGGFLCNGTV